MAFAHRIADGQKGELKAARPAGGCPLPVGRAKVAAIRAALKGRLINGLITDEATAGAVLKP